MNQKTSKSYTSKGERRSMSRDLSKAVKRERTVIDYWTIKQAAWLKNKNPWLSVDNPNTNETNRRKIRVRANTYWGDPNPKIDLRKMANND
jgi:hypothetical protein